MITRNNSVQAWKARIRNLDEDYDRMKISGSKYERQREKLERELKKAVERESPAEPHGKPVADAGTLYTW